MIAVISIQLLNIRGSSSTNLAPFGGVEENRLAGRRGSPSIAGTLVLRIIAVHTHYISKLKCINVFLILVDVTKNCA